MTINQKIERAQFLVLDNFNAPFLTDRAFGPIELERLITKRASMMLTTVLTTRVAPSLKQSQYEDLFEAVRSCMAPMEIRGKNLREDARDAMMRRIHGGGDE